MNSDFTHKFTTLKLLFKVGILGLLLLIPACFVISSITGKILAVAGIALIIPGLVYFYVLTILHWKARYKGTHSDLWGVLLLIETSGWFKLFYLFRHILPDMSSKGRYSND